MVCSPFFPYPMGTRIEEVYNIMSKKVGCSLEGGVESHGSSCSCKPRVLEWLTLFPSSLPPQQPPCHGVGYLRPPEVALKKLGWSSQRKDYVEEALRIVNPVVGADTPVYDYEQGTWGPSEAGN